MQKKRMFRVDFHLPVKSLKLITCQYLGVEEEI